MRNLRQFEVIAEIARQGSISKAAEALRVSQPTISKFLLNVEAELGLELFDRTVIPIRLTPAGARYLSAANKILDVHRQMEKELDDIRNSRDQVLKIGVSPSRAPYILPDLLAGYRAVHPEGKVVIRERSMRQLNDELQRGDLDLILSLLTDETRSFQREDLSSETVLIAAPDSMAAMSPLQILQTQSMITIGSGLRMWKITGKVLEFVGGKECSMECQSIESALALVKKGLGAMLVPSYIAEGPPSTRENITFLPLPESCQSRFAGELKREFCVFYRSNSFLSESERCFIDVCKQARTSSLAPSP